MKKNTAEKFAEIAQGSGHSRRSILLGAAGVAVAALIASQTPTVAAAAGTSYYCSGD